MTKAPVKLDLEASSVDDDLEYDEPFPRSGGSHHFDPALGRFVREVPTPDALDPVTAAEPVTAAPEEPTP